MKRLGIGFSLIVGVLLGSGLTWAYDHLASGPRTQVVATCMRGNTVYTSSTGGVSVLPGC